MKSSPTIQAREMSLHVISVGPFGKSVAQCLRKLWPGASETRMLDDALPMPELWPRAAVTVVAAWRPVPHLCELVDDLSWRWCRPFIPLIADAPVLRLGPTIVPGLTSCWKCWALRSAQHDVWRVEHAALLQRYSSDPTCGPKGFLVPWSMLAAARLLQLLEKIKDSPDAGEVWEINTITGSVKRARSVGIHNCLRCGLHRKEDTRTIAEIEQKLQYLWFDGAAKEAGR